MILRNQPVMMDIVGGWMRLATLLCLSPQRTAISNSGARDKPYITETWHSALRDNEILS